MRRNRRLRWHIPLVVEHKHNRTCDERNHQQLADFHHGTGGRHSHWRCDRRVSSGEGTIGKCYSALCRWCLICCFGGLIAARRGAPQCAICSGRRVRSRRCIDSGFSHLCSPVRERSCAGRRCRSERHRRRRCGRQKLDWTCPDHRHRHPDRRPADRRRLLGRSTGRGTDHGGAGAIEYSRCCRWRARLQACCCCPG